MHTCTQIDVPRTHSPETAPQVHRPRCTPKAPSARRTRDTPLIQCHPARSTLELWPSRSTALLHLHNFTLTMSDSSLGHVAGASWQLGPGGAGVAPGGAGGTLGGSGGTASGSEGAATLGAATCRRGESQPAGGPGGSDPICASRNRVGRPCGDGCDASLVHA